MSAFAVDPVFTPLQWIAFAAFLIVAVLLQYAFSPRRRAIMGRAKFALASAVVWMSGFIFLSQMAVRFLPPLSWLSRDLANAGKAVWGARLNRWMGRP